MSRNNRRREQYAVYQETTLGFLIVGRISLDAGMRKVDDGLFAAVYDEERGGRIAGFHLLAARTYDREAASEATPCAISAHEMQLFAFRRFKDGRSRTAGMSELEKVTRIHPKFGTALPAEDAVELVVEKMRVYPTTFAMVANKVSPHRPKRLHGMKRPIRSFAQGMIAGDVFVRGV